MHGAVQSLVSEGAFEPRVHKPGRLERAATRGLRIALVVPEFYPSYFGYNYMLPLLPGDKRAEMAPGSMPLLAALIPSGHEVEIFDENVAPIDLVRLRTFDLIGITGMIVQADRMKELLDALSDYHGILVVGGPYASVDQRFFAGKCDVLFVGEADTTWPLFLEKVIAGEPYEAIYEQEKRTDLTTLPLPRYDLLDADRYRVASLQFSRGCPFLCEFCDIITIYGRIPRAKAPSQIIEELEDVVKQGFLSVYIVDDNFVGNKKLAKELLIELVRWQEENGYPLYLGTEASINLADEPELLELMYKANFRSLFIGIESPSEEALNEVRKVQNVRGDSLLAKLERIRDAGFIIQAGFIVGFDSDGHDIFQRQFEFIEQAQIAQAGVGILTAIPSTPLYKRLEEAGRLRLGDPNMNFAPLQMSSNELRDGWMELTESLFEPDNYFKRVFGSWGSSKEFRQRWFGRKNHMKASLRGRMQFLAGTLLMLSRLTRALAKDGYLVKLGGAYLRIYRRYRATGVPGITLSQYVGFAAQHWHYYKYFAQTRHGGIRFYNSYTYSGADQQANLLEAP